MANITRFDPFTGLDDIFKGFWVRPQFDISISMDGNLVTIAGEVKKESEEKKGEEVIRSERYYGRVSRSFTLPQEIDEAKSKATYADGVLQLTLATKGPAGSKKLKVS
jgi:HSP20 family protein